MHGGVSAAFADAAAFDGLRQEWDTLWGTSRSRTLFLSWEWLHSWWRHWREGRLLRLVLVRDSGGTLVGIAPLCIERRGPLRGTRVLAFLGTEGVSSDYLDFLASESHEAQVAAAVFALIAQDSASWDLIELSDLLETSLVLRHIATCARDAGLIARRSPDQICPFLTLPQTPEQLAGVLGKRTRAHVGKKRRRLLHAGISIRLIENREELPRALASLFDIHEQRWRLRALPGNFRQDRIRAFHSEVAPLFLGRGWLRLFEASREGTVVAILYGFQDDTTLTYFQSGFLPEFSRYSPGGVLIGEGMEYAIRHGGGRFDFLRGPEPYKWEWTSESRTTHRLTLVRRGDLPTRIRMGVTRLGDTGKRLVKAILRPSKRTRAWRGAGSEEEGEGRIQPASDAP